jgi:hypothetical protein
VRWPIDAETIVQIIVFLFFAGAAIIQVLFRVLGKAAKPPAPPAPQARGAPPKEKTFKNVREFLDEIRAEVAKGGGQGQRQGQPGRAAAPAGEDPVLVWEVVEEGRAAPARPVAGPAAKPVAGPAGSRAERPGRPPGGTPARREKPPKGVHEYLQDLARRDPEAESTPAEEGVVPGVETALAGESEPAPAARRTARQPAALPGGLTLREALIAQAILGPPRCRGPRPRGRRGGL